MIKETPATSPAGRHETASGNHRGGRFGPPAGGTLREALDALELQIVRLEEWGRRHGREFDPAGTHRLAIENLKVVADRLRRTGDETRPLFGQDDRPGRDVPLLKLGQSEYAREVRGNPHTGKLSVQG